MSFVEGTNIYNTLKNCSLRTNIFIGNSELYKYWNDNCR